MSATEITSEFTSDHATFVGFGVEAIAYGAYVVLFFTALSVLTWRAHSLHIRGPLFIITCLLFALATVHFSLNFNNVYNGLLVHPRKISAENQLLEGADMVFYLTDFFSQMVLTYRCWLVFERQWIVTVLPCLMSLVSLSCGAASLAILKKINPTAPQAPPELVPIMTAGFSISFVVNLLVTGLIIGKIWYTSTHMNKIMDGAGDTPTFSKPISIMIESGAPVLVCQFVLLVLFALEQPSQAVMVPLSTQIYGIAPTIIIVRSGTGSAFEPPATNKSTMKFLSFGKNPALSGFISTAHSSDEELGK